MNAQGCKGALIALTNTHPVLVAYFEVLSQELSELRASLNSNGNHMCSQAVFNDGASYNSGRSVGTDTGH